MGNYYYLLALPLGPTRYITFRHKLLRTILTGYRGNGIAVPSPGAPSGRPRRLGIQSVHYSLIAHLLMVIGF